jgi:pyruvate/2-oxoglutarate dehydrogenase complex dihydrolipoamide dehydrogenase (E3) component
MAQAFARLGSAVSLLELADHVLPLEDADAAALLESALARDGVQLLSGARVVRVEPLGGARARVCFERGDGAGQVEVDRVLVALGRIPNVEDLGLEAAGVEHDARGVRVDDRLRTANRRIFAAGDVCLPLKFTHSADASAKLVVQNALFFGRKRVSDLVVPWCTYTDPELAHVGLHAREAQARGIELDTYDLPLAASDRSRTEHEGEGLVRIHTRRGRDRIVGATIVAPHAGELIAAICLAITQRIGLGRLAGVVLPYPTRTELLKATSGAYLRSRLTPALKRILDAWLRLSR